MSALNWAPPGTVASLTHVTGMVQIGLRIPGGWVCADGAHHRDIADENPVSVRELVRIDPDDREQVERIEQLMSDEMGWALLPDYRERRRKALQAALRSLITPPRPEEPTGLGAVVEDDGETWVRVGATIGDFHWRSATRNVNRPWRSMKSPTVHSEGWFA